ncbi:MAG: LamG-like jellyroll fold domain-containing protein [Elusimicrobiota bacterium]
MTRIFAGVILASSLAFVRGALAQETEACPPGTVSYWTFDDPSNPGNDDFDANDGTLVNGPVWETAGRVGGALDFPGGKAYVSVPASGDWDFGDGDFTIDLWAKIENSGNSQYLLSIGDPGSVPVVALGFGGLAPLQNLDFFSTASGWMTEYRVIALGEWHHIAFVRDGNDFYMFLNGQPIMQKTGTGVINSNKRLFIGIRSALDYPTKGLIDEVAIYRRALTPEEIRRHYSEGLGQGYCDEIIEAFCGDGARAVDAGEECDDWNNLDGDGCSAACALDPGHSCMGRPSVCFPDADGDGSPDDVDACGNPGAPAGMASYWRFEETSGGTAHDSYAANRGTLVNGPVWTPAGRAGGALSFDGSNDYVSAPASSDWDLGGGDFTISLWANVENTGNSQYLLSIGDPGSVPVVALGFGGLAPLQNLDFYSTASGWLTQYRLITLGDWHHIAFVRSGNGLHMFLNGQPIMQKTASGSINSDKRLFIGIRSAFDYPTRGLVDEVAIYKRALTAEEIGEQYAKGLAGEGYCEASCTDADGDGYAVEGGDCGPTDCDDAAPEVNPGAPETRCNGVDDDCSAQTPDDSDLDDDGVAYCQDRCRDTEAPEASVPGVRLGTNRFAIVTGTREAGAYVFDTTASKGKGPRNTFTTADTHGCSCEQILAASSEAMKGHRKFGCSISVMEDWADDGRLD